MEQAIQTQETKAIVNATITLGEGFEEPILPGELKLSRAKIVQSTTPEFQADQKNFLLGSVIDNITKQVLPEEFVPITKFTNWIRFNPRKKDDPHFDPAFDPGAIIWMSSDPNDERVKTQSDFGPNGEPPLATRFINYLCVFPGQPLPIIVSFAKTSIKAGITLFNLALRFGGNMYDYKYRLKTQQVKNDQGTYYVYHVEAAGPADAALISAAKVFRAQFAGAIKKIEEQVVAAVIEETQEEGEK